MCHVKTYTNFRGPNYYPPPPPPWTGNGMERLLKVFYYYPPLYWVTVIERKYNSL